MAENFPSVYKESDTKNHGNAVLNNNEQNKITLRHIIIIIKLSPRKNY